MSNEGDITQALSEAAGDAPGATERLIEMVRDDLRRRAAHQLRASSAPATLEPTALVHEVYIRIFGKRETPTWANRGHFFMAASRAMHDILVERARYATRQKRGGGAKPGQLNETHAASKEAQKFLELHEALDRLAALSPSRADIVRLRFYCGVNNHEIAKSLGCSERTVRREWMVAKVWLHQQLGTDPRNLSHSNKF